MSTTIRVWPILYTKGKNGEMRMWEVSVLGDSILVHHGVRDGASVAAERRATPKNVGRSNETSAEQQAILEAEAMHKFKLERKYSLTPEAAQDIVPLPMLAKDFEKAKKVSYPVDVQPKLDGVRAIARWEGDDVVLISRGGKLWTAVPHINAALKTVLPKDAEFDGEIYAHRRAFQWITSRAKKAHEDSVELQYWIYDMPTVNGDDSLTWEQRSQALADILVNGNTERIGDSIVYVESYESLDDKIVKAHHDTFIEEGYEGAIIRLLDGVYEYAHRSSSLLKLKLFDDHEYKIVSHTSGEGIESDLVIWICVDDRGQTFATRPKGTHEDRRWLIQNATKFYGQKLKIKHFGFTDDHLPRSPIAEGIRVAEDMD